MKTLSVITPVYFNEHSLAPLFDELRTLEAALLERGVVLDLIFVDDGSGDNSLRELLKIKEQRPETTVVKLSKNFGSMKALRTGLKFVRGDAFTFLAADLQEPPGLIAEMVEHWLSGTKYVVCARAKRDDPPATQVLSAAYYWALRLLVVDDYPDGGYDLVLMDRAMLKHLTASSKDTNLLLYAHALGFEREEIRYHRRARTHGRSRWTLAKKLNFFVDSILGFSILPLRYVSGLGITVSLLSVFYGLFVVTNALFNAIPVPGWASTVALLSFLFGTVIFMLGLIGEYIWRIFNELNGSPESVIDEVY